MLLIPGPRPGSYGLKLVDYDGMYVPALASLPSGEAGHPNYQHPDRLATRAYSANLDRFPHLVVATSLKALEVLGPDLWGRYDTGDNLLFTEADFRAPAGSALMRELWQSRHPAVRALVGRLAIACSRPAAETPWLDRIVRDGDPVPLDPDAERAAAVVLDPQDLFRPAVPPPAPAVVTPVPDGPDGWETVEDGVEPPVIRDWQPEVEDGSWESADREDKEPEYDRPSAPEPRKSTRRGRSSAWSPPRRRRSRSCGSTPGGGPSRRSAPARRASGWP